MQIVREVIINYKEEFLMKIRKILALLIALSMVAAVMPGLGMTAFAAISKDQGIVTSDGTAYAAASDDLVADGSFETDQWEQALTTGAYVDSAGGTSGVETAITMNTDPKMIEKGAVAFERVEGRTGQAISPAFDAFTPEASVPRYTNDANGPTSIKHYIHNVGTAKKNYYVGFWAKSLDGVASLRYYIGGVGANDKIPSSTPVTLDSESWTHIDAVVEVAGNQYLLLNIFDMAADSIAIDDVEICEVVRNRDSQAFADAIAQWRTVFPYYNNQVLTSDMTLPARSGSATVTWTSSDPDIIDPATGRIAVVKDSVSADLTATLSLGSLSYVYQYTFIVDGFSNRIKAAIEADGFIDKYPDPTSGKIDLPATLEDFEGSVITWASSDESIIAPDGTYNPPAEVSKVTLTPTVSYGGESISAEIEVYVGASIKRSLIPNGAFEVVEGTTVPGWTDGTLADLSTTNFDYMTDADGNHYILSKAHATWNSPSSIREYIDLEPGKFYSLNFKMWYNGAEKCQESYTAAVLVPDRNVDPNSESNVANTSIYGGLYYPGASYNGRLSKDDGWQTVTVPLLKPDETYHTLLISAEWLNKTDGGLPDGRWAFDDFILEEIVSSFNSDVTINYLDENGEPLKKAKVVKNQYGNLEYYADAAEKSDITVGTGKNKETYRYDPENSVDHVLVTEDKNQNVINLYFKKLIPANVHIQFYDRATDRELQKEVVDSKNGFVGYSYTAPGEYKASIEYRGEVYEYDATSTDTIIVDEDEDLNVIKLYFSISDNIIRNGDFSDGVNYWTSRTGGAIDGANIAWDEELQTNAMTITTKGREAANSIGTTWNVEPGKMYHLSFYVGGGKPDSNNLQYNRVADAKDHTVSQTAWDIPDSATIIIPFGEQMVANQWNYLEATFTAKTDTVYFQSSWVDNIKFAKFELKEIDSSNMGNIKINFKESGGSGTVLRDPVTVNDLMDGTTYDIPDEYFEDIVKDNVIYKYAGNVENVVVKGGKTVEVDLFFQRVTSANVELSFIERESGTALSDISFVPAEVGQPFAIPSEYTGTVSFSGKMYAFDGSDPASLTVSSDQSQNKITLYYKAVDNLIPNGDFSQGTEGWTNRRGNAIAEATVETDPEHGNVLSVGGDDGTGGRNDEDNIGTVWAVQTGKTYKLDFDLFGTELTSSNFGFNRISDNYSMVDGNTDIKQNDGNIIYAYGEEYSPSVGSWMHMSKTFTAATDTVYFQSSYIKGFKLANVVLVEVDTSKTGNVKINFLDETGASIKDSVPVNDLVADSTYDVPEEYKADIDVDGVTYKLLPGKSTLSVKVVQNVTTDVNLYFAPAPSTITIANGKAVINANGAVDGVVVIAQFDLDGNLVDVKSNPVNVAAGATESVDIAYAADKNAAIVKAFVLDSFMGLQPLANAISAVVPGAVLPATVFQTTDSLYPVDPATGKVRYTFDFVDNGCTNAAIILGYGNNLIQGGEGSYNFFGNGSIELLFDGKKIASRSADNTGGKQEFCDYTAGETVHVVIDADVAAKTFTATVTTSAGESKAENVAFRTSIDSVDTLAIVENANNGTYGDKAPFDMMNFSVEILD